MSCAPGSDRGREVLFLLDAPALGAEPSQTRLAGFLGQGLALKRASSEAGDCGSWIIPTHYLDTVPRLLECCSLIRKHCTESARLLVFVDNRGYQQLCCSPDAASATLGPASVQCVPFGCEVGEFVLEVARKKTASGCKVVVISNTVKVVEGCRESSAPNLSHIGFMFVDDDLLMPGLQSLLVQVARPVHLLESYSCTESRASNRGSRYRNRSRSCRRARDGLEVVLEEAPECTREEDDGSEATLRDSDLDGQQFDDVDEVADTLVDGPPQVHRMSAPLDHPGRCQTSRRPSLPDSEDAFAYADTQVVEDFSLEAAIYSKGDESQTEQAVKDFGEVLPRATDLALQSCHGREQQVDSEENWNSQVFEKYLEESPRHVGSQDSRASRTSWGDGAPSSDAEAATTSDCSRLPCTDHAVVASSTAIGTAALPQADVELVASDSA